ncbi:MAG TPA: hypothetical protein VFM54_05000, partial [Micromonosporaceae bacterium]|nr:hypothetical protein [Micromonosporaceae bacterium]
ILAVNPVAENAANQYRSAIRELRLRAFNVAATLAVLVVTALSVAMIYGRRSSQTLFARYICGWSFMKAYRPILVFEVIIALLLVSWALLAVRSRPQDGRGAPGSRATQNQPTLDGWEPLIAGSIAVVGIASVTAGLAWFNSRMVRERSAQL